MNILHRTALTLTLLAFVPLHTGARAQSQTVYATDVPAQANWNDVHMALGNPPSGNCNQTGNHAWNPSGSTYLVARDFTNLTVPAWHSVTQVSVQVQARFDYNMPQAALRLRAQWVPSPGAPVVTATRDVTVLPGNGNCLWIPFDITSLVPNWNQAQLNSLTLAVRREGSFPNNTLRVKGFRIAINTTPVCTITQECQSLPNSTGVGTQLTASGVPSLGGSLLLSVRNAPALNYCFTWRGSVGTHVLHGGVARRCFSGGSRIYPINFTDHNGAADFVVSLNHPAFAGVMAGDTVILQCQHRDMNAVGVNYSDALRLLICP